MLLNPTEHQTFNATQQFAFHRLGAEFGVAEQTNKSTKMSQGEIFSPEKLAKPAPSKGCQLNPKGWWIDTP